jgi:hypothetical protein
MKTEPNPIQECIPKIILKLKAIDIKKGRLPNQKPKM